MSRSFKHTPICTIRARDSKYWKRKANHKVRKTKGLGVKSNNYKKVYETWDICDYRFYAKKENFVECADDLKKWERYYHRK